MLAGRVAVAAAAAGARVELVGSVGDDPAGEQVALGLGQAGVGHAALLRDPAGSTPTAVPAGASGGSSLPRLEAEDVELGLSYLTDWRVLVLAELADERVLGVARAAADYHSAQLIVLTEPGQQVPSDPPGATILERPATDDGAFAGLVGDYAVRLEAGEDPAAAWAAAVRKAGWERAEGDSADDEAEEMTAE